MCMFPVIDRKATGIRLREIMDKQGVSVKELQEYLGLGSVQSVYHWLNGLSMPTVDNLYALSQLFQVPIDALVCGSRNISAFKEEGKAAEYCAFCSEKKSAVQEVCTFTYVAVSKEKSAA